MKWAYLDSQYMYLLSPTRSNLGAGGHHGLAGLPDYHISHEKNYVHRGCRIVQGWIELSVFIRKRSGSICLCPREISNLYLLRLHGGCWRLLEAAGRQDGLANASLEAGWMRPLSLNRPFAKIPVL